MTPSTASSVVARMDSRARPPVWSSPRPRRTSSPSPRAAAQRARFVPETTAARAGVSTPAGASGARASRRWATTRPSAASPTKARPSCETCGGCSLTYEACVRARVSRPTSTKRWSSAASSAARSRGVTAPPGRPERWGVWGAISGPPITQAPPLYNRPARAGKGDAGARLQSLADLLHGGEESSLVDEALAIVVDDDAPVDDDRMHAAPVGVVDQVVDRIPERLPLRPPGVEQHEVGALARFNGADLVAQPERRRAESCAHLQRGLGRDEPDVLARVLVLDGGHVHRAHRIEVVRVVRGVAAQRHAHTPRQQLRHASEGGGAPGAFGGRDRAHRDGRPGAGDAVDLR